jgi:hypothetical protein
MIILVCENGRSGLKPLLCLERKTVNKSMKLSILGKIESIMKNISKFKK